MASTSKKIQILWNRFWPNIERWITPPLCVHCGKMRWKNLPLCRECLRELRASREAEAEFFIEFGGIRALYRLTPPLRSLIHGFKYQHQLRHLRFLCAHLRRSPGLVLALGQVDAIVPVPLHSARRRERGYNQAEMIAREIARLSGKPLIAGALRRTRSTSTQTKLGEEARRRNLEGAFHCVQNSNLDGKRVLLVDDVFTTGNTLRICQSELMKAGVKRVEAFVLARVERMSPDGSVSESGLVAGLTT